MANTLINVYSAREVTAYGSAARTATPDTVELHDMRNADGLFVVVDVTAVTATGSITVKVDGVDHTSGKLFNLITSAALTAVGTTTLRIHTNLTAAANLTAADMIPGSVRITVTHANVVAMTYSVGVHLDY